jgi:YHS domain-containing protein
MSMRSFCYGWCLALALALILTAGCKKEEKPAATGKAPEAKPEAAAPVEAAEEAAEEMPEEAALTSAVDDKVKAILAKADALDGDEDHVISKCAACMFAMDGDPEHMIEFMGYEMHFCSEECKAAYEEGDVKQLVLALKVPETPTP